MESFFRRSITLLYYPIHHLLIQLIPGLAKSSHHRRHLGVTHRLPHFETTAGKCMRGDLIGSGSVQDNEGLNAAREWSLFAEKSHAAEISFAFLTNVGDQQQRRSIRILRLRAPLRGESATAVREQIAGNGPWRNLLPEPVADYIVDHRLYGAGGA